MSVLALLDFTIIGPALAAGFVILLSHAPMGREVLSRGIIFIDLAVAQFAGFGIIAASLLGLDTHGWELQAIALVSAMTGAFLLSMTEKLFSHHQEAAIGILFILAATGSILLLANNPHGGEQLKGLLVGQILWVEWQQLIFPALVGISVFAISLSKPRLLTGKYFYIVFAIAVTTSVQLIGVYLVFASLIIPALATATLPLNKAIVLAIIIGTTAYGLGLISSTLLDLPSGALIVWSMAITASLSAAIFKSIKSITR